MLVACVDDISGVVELAHADNWLKGVVAPNPHTHWVLDAFALELEGPAIEDICPNVLGVG